MEYAHIHICSADTYTAIAPRIPLYYITTSHYMIIATSMALTMEVDDAVGQYDCIMQYHNGDVKLYVQCRQTHCHCTPLSRPLRSMLTC